jgi:hypothetical protein
MFNGHFRSICAVDVFDALRWRNHHARFTEALDRSWNFFGELEELHRAVVYLTTDCREGVNF